MNEVVKYSNELHELKFNTLNEAQQNVFFTLLQQFRNTDGYTLELDFNKIFELADIAQGTNYRKEILAKLRQIQTFTFMFQINDLGDLQQDVIFPSIQTDSENRILKVKVSKGFKDRYINSPLKGWTRYELAEFVGLSGTYTKTIYRYLKQFKNNGYWRIRYKDFKELLGIPDSYRARDIDKQILKPAIKELSSELTLFDQRRTPFQNLSVTKHKKGREIEALEFSFMPQPVTMLEKDKQQYERSLNTIANEIKRQGLAKEIKRSTPKINIITGEPIDELKTYVGRHLSFYDKTSKLFDTLKIESVEQQGDKIIVHLFNQDDDHRSKMIFDSLAHFKNTFEKHKA